MNPEIENGVKSGPLAKIGAFFFPKRLRSNIYLATGFAFVLGMAGRYATISAFMAFILFLCLIGIAVTLVRMVTIFFKKKSQVGGGEATRPPVLRAIGATAILALTVPMMLGIGYTSALAITPLSAEEILANEVRAEQRKQEQEARAEAKAERDAEKAAERAAADARKQAEAEAKQAERQARDAEKAAERAAADARKQAEAEAKQAERQARDAEKAAERAAADARKQAEKASREATQDEARQQQEQTSPTNSSRSPTAPTQRQIWEQSMRDDGWFQPTDGIWFAWDTDYTCGYYNCIYAYIAVEETCMGGVTARVAIYRGNISIGSDSSLTSALIVRGSQLPIAEVSFIDLTNSGDSWELTHLRCLRR